MNPEDFRPVIIESPYAGDLFINMWYLRLCMADCLKRGEAPFASHALYTQPGVLDDGIPAERLRGINAGFRWRRTQPTPLTVFYTDLGWSGGMVKGKADADAISGQFEERRLFPALAHDQVVATVKYMRGLGVLP